MKDILTFFSTPSTPSARSQEVIAAAEQGRWADATDALSDVLTNQDPDASDVITRLLSLTDAARVIDILATALSRSESDGLSARFWQTVFVDDESTVVGLRGALDGSVSIASEAAWIGLGARPFARAELASDPDETAAMVRAFVAHPTQRLGSDHPLSIQAMWIGVDALLLRDDWSMRRSAHSLLDEMLESTDRSTHIDIAVERGLLFAEERRWDEALAAWSTLGTEQARRARLGVIAGIGPGVAGVVASCRANLTLFPDSLSPLIATCCFELSELDGTEDGVTAAAAQRLRTDAEARVAAWLASVEQTPHVIEELAALACARSGSATARERIVLLAETLTPEGRTEFRRVLGELLEDVARLEGSV